MKRILTQFTFAVVLIISLVLVYSPFGFSLNANALENADGIENTPTSTAPLEGDVDEGETIIPISAPDGEVVEIPSYLVYQGSNIPVIFPRSTWETDESLEKLLAWLPEEGHAPPDYHPIERIVVHDLGCSLSSPSCNNDDIDPIAIIQSIYRFHSVTRGWGDIGYNYIIDRKGRIYEGRHGGNAVRAAHVYDDKNCRNYNPGTVGIMLIGNYSSTPIPQVIQESLARLTAWIATTNNLDLSKSTTTQIWTNPKTGTYCNVSTGGFTSSFTGPVLLSHGDIETGNSDKFDLREVNQKAISVLAPISKYVYAKDADTESYKLEKGTRIAYSGDVTTGAETLPASTSSTSSGQATSTEAIIENAVSQLPKLLAINESQLFAFPPSQAPLYSDGTIVRSLTRPLLFLIENGARKKITSSSFLTTRGLNLANAITITDRELGGYPYRGLLGFSEGSLVADNKTGDVYLVENNKRRHVTSAALFNALKFVWSHINPASQEELKLHTVGDPLLFVDGTLVKGSAPRVWLIDSKKRRPISSPELFEARGLQWSEIKTLEDYEAERYSLGTFVAWPDATLIRGEGTPEVYIVKNNGSKEWVPSAEEFINRGYQWQDVKTIPQEELKDYPLVGLNPTTVIQEETKELDEPSEESTVDETSSPPNEENPPIDETEKGPDIRIAIYSLKEGEHVAMRAVGGTFRVLHNGNLILETKSQDEEFIVQYNELNPIGVARFEPIGNAILEITSYDARHPCVNNETWCRDINDNKFRGAIEIVYSNASKKFWVVNELPLEDYLKGVAEILNGDPPEYLNAFTIASRSYALYHLNRGGKRTGEPYHLNNTSSDQLYKGYGFEKRAPDPVRAVDATRGKISTYNRNVIVAAYSSGAPGPTLSACDDLRWSGFCDPEFDYLDGGADDPEGTKYSYTSCGEANHCVGIDAAGARQMASLGKTYEEILKWYYPGIEITQRY